MAAIVNEKTGMCVLQTWQRLTLPRLETKYHQRWSVSRPSSEWDRVQPLRYNHQVSETHIQLSRSWLPAGRICGGHEQWE